ncbi:histone deacetylase family protein [Dasania sp. GY-MA-18]|uniref:Histone deacetylase family protein n=1 Tax=Dasania phycosphaerae TaxID=2950436 RepID=A0A9J6RL13_9GAMM|nr:MULTISPECIES: histone deacetylase family protein [Dasania]MCR8922468.1 histone deacetylase family protein [Dasania sp. GY-MA-18]MCZ0864896.1 histone deacetylase family protein [Dasania phycosphaerae]MCZ0868624.1 histone deacetylase family protein [Dasania phycosphaerae]
MFRIHKIYDVSTASNQQLLSQVQAMLRVQFNELSEKDIAKLPAQLANPLKYRFHSRLLVAEDGHAKVRGFALLLHAPDLQFCFLDYICAGRGETGGGIGGALYERVREEAFQLKALGLFMECLPDDPALSPNAETRKQNIARLRFYERYGARPLANTAYETPVNEKDTDPPYLVFDNLGQHEQVLHREPTQAIVRAILERKYAKLCPPAYIDKVVNSISDEPVQLRQPRYIKKAAKDNIQPKLDKIALIINHDHDIHHIKERGYVEAPVRIQSISKELARTQLFETLNAKKYGLHHIEQVHKPEFVHYLRKACAAIPQGQSVYPYVFPIRNRARPPQELPLRAGYYCIDTFTPLNSNAYLAARGSVDCAMTAADCLLDGRRIAYALVRPPGHHAEHQAFGGFCYFNSAAVAAHHLSLHGKVALFDIDYHHGNGSQDIFYQRRDVYTLSIHGHPRHSYPYFSGFDDEKGEAEGKGYNRNYPLAENINGEQYRLVLNKALQRIANYQPSFLVLALGLDTAKGDPTGSFQLMAEDFYRNGELIGALKLPTLVIQEGGYKTQTLGINARHFFNGLWQGMSA